MHQNFILAFNTSIPHQIKIDALPPDQVGAPFSNLNDFMNHLQSIGIDMYVKRLTTCDIYQFGHEVARVLSPNLMPLHGHHQLAALQCSHDYGISKKYFLSQLNLQNLLKRYIYGPIHSHK